MEAEADTVPVRLLVLVTLEVCTRGWVTSGRTRALSAKGFSLSTAWLASPLSA